MRIILLIYAAFFGCDRCIAILDSSMALPSASLKLGIPSASSATAGVSSYNTDVSSYGTDSSPVNLVDLFMEDASEGDASEEIMQLMIGDHKYLIHTNTHIIIRVMVMNLATR